MTPAALRQHCLALPGTTVSVQWGADHVFKIGGKMFACIGMHGGQFTGLSFKCSPDSFALLIQTSGIRPAPYLARAQWVALADLAVLPDTELRAYLDRAYAIVRAALPRKAQAVLPAAGATNRIASGSRPARRSSSAPTGTSARSERRRRRPRP